MVTRLIRDSVLPWISCRVANLCLLGLRVVGSQGDAPLVEMASWVGDYDLAKGEPVDTPLETVLHADREIENGGLKQLYYNWGAKARQLSRVYASVGATTLANVLARVEKCLSPDCSLGRQVSGDDRPSASGGDGIGIDQETARTAYKAFSDVLQAAGLSPELLESHTTAYLDSASSLNPELAGFVRSHPQLFDFRNGASTVTHLIWKELGTLFRLRKVVLKD